jgi:glycosyltransferase involved in cell wall biosynthesis
MPTLVSVVVPCYNEAENVPLLTAKVCEVFAALPDYSVECIFVNDGSTDGTREALDALARANPRVRPIHLARNCGQSGALLAGLRRARGEYLLTLDGDLQNDPADFPKMLELLQQYDCVCGYRVQRNDAWLRSAVSRAANRVLRRMVGNTIRDTGCGTKGFRRVCVQHFIPFNGVHRFLAVMVQNGGLTVTECPVTHHPRVHGVSKYGIGNRLWRTLYDLVGVGWLRKRYIHPEVEGE